ncbi:MAG TPA: UvrD-helicase domain-containing protein [Thermoanaerobaculia bacterium]|jgi:superfamily I DNA/RNA helicase|nr:UvrD-helicase domain-containing protein [Thermoanaerobaculia bacterium]
MNSGINFILVDYGSATEIIGERNLQSADFAEGAALAESLHEREIEGSFLRSVRYGAVGEGMFFLKPNSKGHFLVFDLAQANPFNSPVPGERLLIFQRVCRFAVRIWDNLKLSASERMITDSSKAAIFPFPFSSQSEYRITVERNPDPKRSEKRFDGNHLLVFKEGYNEGAGAAESPQVHNFRQALKDVQLARGELFSETQTLHRSRASSALSPLSVTQLTALPANRRLSGLGLDEWIPRLTLTQRLFVERTVSGAERIEGPAGTGKTLCLALRCLNVLKAAAEENRDHRSLFIAHSQATAEGIRQLFASNEQDGHRFSGLNPLHSAQSVQITTLQAWCGHFLGEQQITEAQFLDRDALESKELRVLYIQEAFEEAMAIDFATHKEFMSEALVKFLSCEQSDIIAEMLQHEIGVMIKGRAMEDLDAYRKLPIIKYGLPIENSGDRGYIFVIFNRYRQKLMQIAQFDTDDVVLTALAQLQTPIWRRRRLREGFNSIFLDETHLFNINELSVFHHLTSDSINHALIFSADHSQAIGDHGINKAILDEAILQEPGAEALATSMKAVFRCSPQITALAASVTASGATLFTNFDNPMNWASSTFTVFEEQLAETPTLWLCKSDQDMIAETFLRAEAMAKDIECSKSEILITVFGESLFNQLRQHAEQQRKPVELLVKRGDMQGVARARKNGQFVVSTADFVGGLEFSGTILVGVDEGRVPPSRDLQSLESKHFVDYRSHNRLYVAITRAKYRLEIMALRAEGPSPILKSALSAGLLIQN